MKNVPELRLLSGADARCWISERNRSPGWNAWDPLGGSSVIPKCDGAMKFLIPNSEFRIQDCEAIL